MSGPLADRLGRKKSITIACVIYVVGILIQISTQTAWYQYIIGRYIGGIGIGALSVLAPMYESESAPSHIRGLVVWLVPFRQIRFPFTLDSTYQLMITAGILVGNLVVLGTESISSRAAWQIPLGLSFLWALVLALGITILPESPRYDYIKGRQQRSRQTMALFHGVETDHVVIATAMAQMEAKLLAEQRAGSQSWKTLFTGPTMMYRVVLGATLMAFQQLTGANYFFYYGTTIFQSTGLDNSYVTQIILGSVNFVSTLFGLWLISVVSRRKCLIYGALWMFVCFIIFASLGEFALVDADGTNNAGVGGVMIAVSCLFIGAFASTWGPLIWTVVSEMYPSSHRAACMGVATCANWGFTFLIAFFTPFITKVIGYKYGYIFAGCCLLGCLIVYLFLIESKDRTLEEIDSMYLLRVKPWASQTWTHPQANGEVNAQASKVETLENRTVEGET